MSTTQTDSQAVLAPPGVLESTPADSSPLDSEEAAPPGLAPCPEGLAYILRMKVPIIVKLAERDLPVASVLKLNIGSILEFNRPVDSELDLLVNNRVVGKGVPVKVGENFGLRLTRIGNVEKTIKALGQ